MKPDASRIGLVRGVIGVSHRGSGSLSVDPKDAEARGNIVAYTHWFRHDDDLKVLEEELESLVRCYARMRQTDAMMYGYEYKDYKH